MKNEPVKEIFLRLRNEHDKDAFVYSGPIEYGKASGFVDMILEKEDRAGKAILYLTTPGGEPNAAFRMIKALKARYNEIDLGVYGPCKSAGTLLALGASRILMSDTGELGPLDVQMTKRDELFSSSSGLDIFTAMAVITQNAFDIFEQYMIALISDTSGSISTKTAGEIASNFAVGLFTPIMAQIDPNRLGEAQRAIKIANAYADRMGQNNLKPSAMQKLVEGYPSHGFVIDLVEAKELFLHADTLDGVEAELAHSLRSFLRHPKQDAIFIDIGSMVGAIREESGDEQDAGDAGSQQNIPERNGRGETNSSGTSPEFGSDADSSDKHAPPDERRDFDAEA